MARLRKSLGGKVLGKQAILRSALDSIWGWLLKLHVRPQGLRQLCETAILEELEDEAAGDAREVAGSFYSLSYAVEENNMRDCFQVLSNGLNIVEAFVYGELLKLRITSENDLVVDQHELIHREIRCQEQDLALVQNNPSISLVISELRKRSKGQSILGDYWYKN
jgi:hypothetical protein